MKAQTRLSRHPRSWRSRTVACGLTVWALAWATSGLHADNNQTGFSDSDPFPLDTGEDPGSIQSGLGTSPAPGFSLDTRDDPSSVDLAQSGFADSDPFPLDTGGPASGHENNQSDFADSGAFELDTQDSSLSGLADSGEFPLDTRNSGGGTNQPEFGFGDSPAFVLDTTDPSSQNLSPAFQADGNLTVSENQTFVFDFNATDPDGDALSYSLLYGDDLSHFELNSTSGILSFINPKDFENPDDNDSNNVYELTAQVSDGNSSAALNLTVRITDLFENAGPTFQSDGNLTVPENQTFVFDFNASDPDGDPLSYSLLYGDDFSLFELNSTTGELNFIATKEDVKKQDVKDIKRKLEDIDCLKMGKLLIALDNIDV